MSLKHSSQYLVVIFMMMFVAGLLLTYTPLITDTGGAFYYSVYAGENAYAELAPEIRDYHLFVYGVMGSVMSAWCVLLAYIAANPLRQGERWAWNLILVSVIIWFVGDSFISGATGFWLHVGLNAIFMTLIEIGLWMSYRHIRKAPSQTPEMLLSA